MNEIIKRVNSWKYKGDANIGLYGFSTDKYTVFPEHTQELYLLSENIIKCNNILPLCSILLAGNSYGIIGPYSLEDNSKEEITKQAKNIGIEVEFIKSKENAIGNLILTNDKGAVISQTLKDHKKIIEDVLNVEVTVGKIMGLDIVGSLGIATNKGFLISTYATEEEYARIKDALKVDGDIGTVNYGSPFIKSGIIANSRGVLIGENSTGIEVGRIVESLDLTQ